MIFRKRRRSWLDVEMRTDRTVYRPGETVRATVRLTANGDLSHPEVSVALVHVDSVRHETTSTDSWAVDGRYVVEETRMRDGETVEHVVDLRIPERTTPWTTEPDETGEPLVDDPEDFRYFLERSDLWGAPTSVGERVRSEWFVQVEGRGTGTPVDTRVPVAVLALAGTGRPGSRSRGPADVVVQIPDRSVAPGETVTGRVRFTPEKELSVRGLRLDLLQIERTEDTTLSVRTRVSVPLSGAETLPARMPRDLAFSITVPEDAAPTARTDAADLTWELRGIVDLALREDAVGAHELVVHS
jgi:hypothetical protein